MASVMFKNTMLFQPTFLSCFKDMIINVNIKFSLLESLQYTGNRYFNFSSSTECISKIICQQACGDNGSISDLDSSKSFHFYRSPVKKKPRIYLQIQPCLPSDHFLLYLLFSCLSLGRDMYISLVKL